MELILFYIFRKNFTIQKMFFFSFFFFCLGIGVCQLVSELGRLLLLVGNWKKLPCPHFCVYCTHFPNVIEWGEEGGDGFQCPTFVYHELYNIQFVKEICSGSQCFIFLVIFCTIVFRFIIEYSSLRDFYRPLGNNSRSIFYI